MDTRSFTWALAVVAALIVVATVGHTLRTRRSVQRTGREDGKLWRRSYHLGAELAAGRSPDTNGTALVELVEQTDQPMMVAAALAVAVRQEAGEVHPVLFRAVGHSRLPMILRDHLESGHTNTMAEALEVVEVLRVDALLGDAAALSRHADPVVVRAACDAVVEIEPSIGLGILVGLADSGDSWVLDALGRAAVGLGEADIRTIPLSRAQWGSAPMLAQRALTESATFDRATVSDAIAALVGALDATSSSKRLAAVTALAASIDHPAAQIALAGALGADERMIRFATAANLAESVKGQNVLRQAAASADGSDAARMASEILWAEDPFRKGPLRVVAS